MEKLSNRWFALLVLVLVCASVCTNAEACYKPFGCFPITSDFQSLLHRPINLEPWSPEKVNTHFYLYAKWLQNDTLEQACGNGNEERLKGDGKYAPCVFTTKEMMNETKLNEKLKRIASSRPSTSGDSNRKPWLATIAHGFVEGPSVNHWMSVMKNLLLDQDSERQYEFIVITDWTDGCQMPYSRACANTRLVGTEIAYFLRHFSKHFNWTNDRVQMIGHSLGAHLSAYAAKNFTKHKIAQLTALDPAGPFFEDMPAVVRVDRNDAQFVDAIHTNGKTALLPGLGAVQSMAHLDFYPNGGQQQPGCLTSSKPPEEFEEEFKKLPPGTYNIVLCNHIRSVLYFLRSIPGQQKACPFKAVKCDSWDKYKQDKCSTSCSGDNCPQMGFFAFRSRAMAKNSTSVKLYLETTNETPFC